MNYFFDWFLEQDCIIIPERKEREVYAWVSFFDLRSAIRY